MGPLGTTIPKALIRLGPRPIIEESIERLISVGVGNIVIVTGHLANSLSYLQDRYAGIVQLIHNAEYRLSGSMYGLYLARNVVKGKFLLLESDITYEKMALTILMGAPFDNVILLQTSTDLGDELFVEAEGGLLKRVSKDRRRLGSEIVGVYTGLFKISQSLFSSMITSAEELFQSSLDVAHGTFLVSMTGLHDIHCVTRSDFLCMEIDDPHHLAIAQSSVYPKIRQKDGKNDI
jgi:2-aminoethylphosphonate-pyruvate transaminase